jgi:tartronate-semialdehyde synthase
MGAEIDAVTEFEELAASHKDAPTSISALSALD